MVLKKYQIKVIDALIQFFTEAEKQKSAIEQLPDRIRETVSWVDSIYNKMSLSHFGDRPKNGLGVPYPRFCLKVPTAGGKTLIAIETIRQFQNLFVKKRTGCVVWITHRETIYKQTIENLRNKNHIYRQWLDQCSGNRTIILEKGQPLRLQDVQENLVILMLIIHSINREDRKFFEDSGGYTEFFPPDNQYDEHEKLLKYVPNLDTFPDNIFHRKLVKTSFGNAIRMLNPLIIVDEFHTMFSDIAKQTLDRLNAVMVIGLSATPAERRGMNVFIKITGQELKIEDMIKLDLHIHSPPTSEDWHEMINQIKQKRDTLEKEAIKLNNNRGIYIRPITLIQAERTGRDQRGRGFIHSEDVRDYLIQLGIPAHEIAIKSSDLNELKDIKQSKLLSNTCEIRYIITKEALKEGWDCSFAYILGIIPSARSETSTTQLVGRILRQPYAKKTGINDLDESYVYFTKGETEDVLRNVQRGFLQEGLGDLVADVHREPGPSGSTRIRTKIKPEILKKYPESLFLPVWVVKENGSYRRFSYEIDIRSKFVWSSSDCITYLKDVVFPVVDKQLSAYEYLVDLYNKYEKKDIIEESAAVLEVSYLARRIYEIIENAFISYSIANELITVCKTYKDVNKLKVNSGFIINEIVKKLLSEKEKQEKEIFASLIENKNLLLSVSDNEEIGYSIPKVSEVYPEYPETFRLNIYEKSDYLSMNGLEKRVARYIDSKDSVIWWMRNRVDKKYGYSIRGWKKGRFYPDFIAAKKNKDDSIELVYVLESKGEHLLGNSNTQYKKSIFDNINKESVEPITLNIIKLKMNDKFRFELVEQGQEELKINQFFSI